MSHGASRSADSIQRTAQICSPQRERHIARAEPSAAWPTHAGPAGAGQGRQPAEPGARSASFDRRRLFRQRLARPNGAARPNRAAPLAHCADMLSAKENPDPCKVRPCQKSCDKSLHCHAIDRSAPWALYPAIKRSMSRASPFPRRPSPNCDRAKRQFSTPAADSVR
jgi:hypothetical protein